MADPVSYRITEIAKRHAKDWVLPGQVVLDATAGNGFDTKLLSELVGEDGKVYAFDIQQQALDQAAVLTSHAANVEYILDSHEYLDRYVEEELDFAMFNLGYLPGGDEDITTGLESTLLAVKKTLDRLRCGRALAICIYPGHQQGMEEGRELESFFASMSTKSLFVLKTTTLNAANSPYCLLVIKRKGYPVEGR